jgi:hypothetical protein
MIKKLLAFIVLLIALPITTVFAQEDATDEGNTIRETVRQKLLSVSNKPMAYIGTITDIVEATIQLENSEGEIQQVAFDTDNTTFMQLNGTSKEIESDDVAIGDYIVAMGYIDNSEVLSTSRVLVTSPIGEIDRKIIFGKVSGIDNKEVSIETKDDGEIVVIFPRSWKGPEIEDFDVGDEIVVVVIPNDDGELEVRTLSIPSSL